MVKTRQHGARAPISVTYAPQVLHPSLPVEVLGRAELVERITGLELASRQRADFHQLIVCTSGTGRHNVDYEPIHMSRGVMLRIFPGQVQQFEPTPPFDAEMVVWPLDSHETDAATPTWYPGSGVSTRWNLDEERLHRVVGWIEELRAEQARFDASPPNIELMKTILRALLLRLAIEVPDSSPDSTHLPQAYVDYRALMEEMLFERPTVIALADRLGYSSRTIDRACQQVSGQTARQVLDERVALEVRRLLTHTSHPIARIGVDFGFSDPSNFSKFVKRHLGSLPGRIRESTQDP